MSFRIHALAPAQFAPMFDLPGDQLARLNARRVTVESCPGTPCRVSLEDTPVGEEVLLVHFEHQPANTPYKSGFAIFVRKGVEQAFPAVGEIPKLFRHRLMSLRGFDSHDNLMDADAVEGAELEGAIEALFADPHIAYIHLHNAKPGCFAARVTRA